MNDAESRKIREMLNQVAEEPIALEACTICGKDLFDGDVASAVTRGSIRKYYEGFGSDSEPWDYVFCAKCYSEKFLEIMGGIDEVLVYLRLTEGGEK